MAPLTAPSHTRRLAEFAAGLTYVLAKGLPVEEALALASVRGATAVTRRGAYGGTLGLRSGG